MQLPEARPRSRGGSGLRGSPFGLGTDGPELRVQLFLPLRAGGDQLRLELVLDIRPRLLPGFGNRVFVMGFEGSKLLVERAAQLCLQVVQRHRWTVLSHCPAPDQSAASAPRCAPRPAVFVEGFRAARLTPDGRKSRGAY